MFLVLASNRICYLGGILLICVACFQQCASEDWIKDLKDAEKKYNQLVKWPLSPLGRLGSDIVGLVMTKSSKALNQTLRKGGESQLDFATQAMFQNLKTQVGLAVCVAIGILICLFLLFLPCWLLLCRSRQRKALEKSASEKRIDSKSRGCCLFEIFMICIAVVILGAVIVIIGSIRSYRTLEVPFKFAHFTVKAAFGLKSQLLVNHQSRLNDVSRSAFDVITLLNNVNEAVSSDFMQRLQSILHPIVNIASAVKWELVKVIQLLETEGTLFNQFINDTMNYTNTRLDLYTKAVENLKKELNESEATVLDPYMNISKLSLSYDSADGYFEPIRALEKVSTINLQKGLNDISTDLKQIVIHKQLDPSNLTEHLKHAAFKVQKNLAESTEKYVLYVNAYVKDQDREPLIKQIKKAEMESMALAYVFHLVILVLAVTSLVLAIALVLAYHGGVCGTSCFRIVRERNRKVFLRSNTSHRSGGAILFFCYLIAIFLWVCWLCCVFLFFMTSLPLTCCRALNDYSIFDMTFDSLQLRSTPGWYSLLTSDAFNMTLKQTVIRCQNDSSFVPTLPDPLVNASDLTQIKSVLNFAELVESFRKETERLSPNNYTGFDSAEFEFELTDLLEDINISPPFDALESFLASVQEQNATEILNKIKKDNAKDQDVIKLADAVQRVYDSLAKNVTKTLNYHKTFESKIESANLTLKSVLKHMVSLNWTADALYSSVINESSALFDTSLNVTLNKLIDSIFVEMQLAALDYRKSMSLCGAITNFYKKATGILCNVLLYPIACCWFGFFLLDLFLLIAIVLSVKSVRFFRFLPDAFQEERVVPGAVRADAMPTRTSSSISSDLKENEDVEVDDIETKDLASEVNDSTESYKKQTSPPKPED